MPECYWVIWRWRVELLFTSRLLSHPRRDAWAEGPGRRAEAVAGRALWFPKSWEELSPGPAPPPVPHHHAASATRGRSPAGRGVRSGNATCPQRADRHFVVVGDGCGRVSGRYIL